MKKKKLLKVIAGLIVGVLLLLAGIPLFLEAKIGPILRSKVNDEINGHFDFEDASLSLIRSFPSARITLHGVSLTTASPFEGDTLALVDEAYLVMGLGQMLSGGDAPLAIDEIRFDGADLRLKVDAEGRANYLIAKESDSESVTSAASTGTDSGPGTDSGQENEGLALGLKAYSIHNSRISYEDAAAGIYLVLDSLSHSGSGDLSLARSELDTRTEALVGFAMDSTTYLSGQHIDLLARIGIDLEASRYTFLDNEAHINQMPLVFQGSLQLLETGQLVDLEFHTPTADFKNFLGLVPAAYATSLDGVRTSGQFRLSGTVKGLSNEERIPELDISMEASEAAFRYPDLPAGVDDIQFLVRVINTTGSTDDTYLEIPNARFRIDQDAFALNGEVRSLTGNPAVSGSVTGSIDLGNLARAYPVDLAPGLRGKLRADLETAFDLESVRAGRYERTRTSGTLKVRDLEFHADALGKPVHIGVAALRFDPASARMEQLSGTLGNSDFSLTGSVRNYLSYLLGDGKLEGSFDLNSGRLDVADFEVAGTSPDPSGAPQEQAGDESGERHFTVPDNLDLAIQARAGTVVYDDLVMNNVSGNLYIHDRQMELKDVRSNALGGGLAFDGLLETREVGEKPAFRMDLGIDGFRVNDALQAIDLFGTLAPIAAILEGKMNSKISLGGLLNDDFSPDLMSLAGNVVAEVLAGGASGSKAQVLEALDSRLDFFNANELDLKGLKTVLVFSDGRVAVKPMQFNYRDIAVVVEGGHSFDKQLEYSATLQVPAKYLGTEVNRLVSELKEPGLQEAKIPVMVQIGGSYDAPTVQTDLKQAVTGLTTRLVEAKKNQLLAAGTSKASDLMGNLLKGAETQGLHSGDTIPGSSEPGSDTGAAAQGSGNVKESLKQPAAESARKLLGGLADRFKKKDTVQ